MAGTNETYGAGAVDADERVGCKLRMPVSGRRRCIARMWESRNCGHGRTGAAGKQKTEGENHLRRAEPRGG